MSEKKRQREKKRKGRYPNTQISKERGERSQKRSEARVEARRGGGKRRSESEAKQQTQPGKEEARDEARQGGDERRSEARRRRERGERPRARTPAGNTHLSLAADAHRPGQQE